ncbi:MAG TPA: lipoyl(octanoyl) transferase LipB [Frankiaceae bacterium]
MEELLVADLGEVEYTRAWAWQDRLHDRRVAGEVGDLVLLVQHPAVYTAGRRTTPEERPFDGTPVVDVDRGGKITWHGPGQLVGYPIVGLPPLAGEDAAAGGHRGLVDVTGHVRRIEQALLDVCAGYGLPAVRVEGRSGVWLPADARGPERKLGAIGIRVSSGVTTHGFSLNVCPDLGAYGRIVPCGIADAGVTSLAAETGLALSVDDVVPAVVAALGRRLLFGGPTAVRWTDPAALGLPADAPAAPADGTDDEKLVDA